MAIYIYYQILANAFILKFKQNENINSILPIDILLMVVESSTFVWHLVRMAIWIRPVEERWNQYGQGAP